MTQDEIIRMAREAGFAIYYPEVDRMTLKEFWTLFILVFLLLAIFLQVIKDISE